MSPQSSSNGDFGQLTRKPPKRTRVKASHSKVRTGCARCRQRRVKCDETKPACLRCIKVGETCSGYQPVQIKVFGLTVSQGFDTAFEKKCFDSFVTRGFDHLVLFQPSSRQFWSSLMPQLSQIYLPMRHSAVALALINEPLFVPELGVAARNLQSDLLSDVMKHFNRSIQAFARQMNTLSIEARLSCCFLYTALTIYMYRVPTSSMHMLAAYRFMRDFEKEIEVGRVLANPALTDTLMPILRRLFIDAATFSDVLARMPYDTPYEDWIHDLLHMPQVFATIEDAYEVLGHLMKYAIAISLGHIKFGSKTHKQLQRSIKKYEMVLDDSPLDMYGGEKVPTQQKRFFRKDLKLHHRVAQILCKCTPETMEHSFWAFTADFQWILQQMSALMELEPLGEPKLTLGWTPPLFLVATRCRVSRLRREALRLLHALERVERPWSSCIAHAIAEFVVDLEEMSDIGAQDPTSFTYVRLLSVRFDPDKAEATATYDIQVDQRVVGTESRKFMLRTPANTLMGANGVNLPDPVLRASGYSGTTLWTPHIECHCLRSSDWLEHRGRKIEAGTIEEVVVGTAGMQVYLGKESWNSPTNLC
ncbi:hypothetical protein OHC33_002241 [Knufia fluminis]|uniref:Zn(2)-C6 fungal-type domain-containing protein n=1 Tax=Knufia fluminis TaxID=191047 RepID=A0AAN8EQU3_9EURO|nr:hypothetical protein OHC33_002241 [Knufia fluminis]